MKTKEIMKELKKGNKILINDEFLLSQSVEKENLFDFTLYGDKEVYAQFTKIESLAGLLFEMWDYGVNFKQNTVYENYYSSIIPFTKTEAFEKILENCLQECKVKVEDSITTIYDNENKIAAMIQGKISKIAENKEWIEIDE